MSTAGGEPAQDSWKAFARQVAAAFIGFGLVEVVSNILAAIFLKLTYGGW